MRRSSFSEGPHESSSHGAIVLVARLDARTHAAEANDGFSLERHPHHHDAGYVAVECASYGTSGQLLMSDMNHDWGATQINQARQIGNILDKLERVSGEIQLAIHG